MSASYPLSPLQQGMLYQAVYGKAPGVYVQQLVGEFHEALDIDALRRAWQRVIERHAILRTVFLADDSGSPVQRVEPQAELPIEQQDWREVPESERAPRLEAFLKADRQRGFDYRQAPAMRLAVLRWGDADYRLVWSYSHVALDGRARLIVQKEVLDLYDAYRQGRDLSLEQPPAYADYIHWLGQQDWTKAEAFWRKSLANFSATTPLPALSAFCPPEGQEGDPGQTMTRLSVETTAALKALSRRHRCTLNTVFQAAWALLLSRYSGEEEVVFGATRACRSSALEGAESMVGVFINTLPMRVRVSPDQPLGSWLEDLRMRALAQIPFEHTPLIKVQEWSSVAGGTALFDSIAVFENYEMNEALRRDRPDWTQRGFRLMQRPSFPLALTGYGCEELLLELLYDAGRYDRGTVTRLVGHVRTLLESMAAQPEAKLCDLAMLPTDEYRQIVHDWNATRAPFPEEKLIHQLVEEQVRRTRDAVAVIFEGRQYTYLDINARANQLAHYLRTLGVGPNVLVDVLMVRSADLIVALLGVLKAGGAYVPLDPNFPKDRLAFLIRDTQPQVILTQENLLDKLPDVDIRSVCIDTQWPEIARESEENLASINQPTDRAYIIFTSGSTGIPKGVVLQHRAVVNTLDWVNKTFRVGLGDKLLFVTSQCFDLSVYDMFGSLSAGSTVRVASVEELRNPEQLLQIVCDEGITFWDSAPPMLQQLVPFLDRVKDGAARKAKLRLAFLSGDWIPVPMPDQMRAVFPHCEMVSLGGATEAAIWSNYYRIGAVDPKWPSIPYGKPFQNCRYHVLDKSLQPVPVGVPAELHIGGVCLAAGYHNRPELSAERFIADPLHPDEPEARLYKTGDLARYLPDGNLEFLGRIDFQVKIRGYRIELGEIEAALGQHPAVRESVVVARPDETGSKVLVAYVVPKPGAEADRNDLKAFLQTRLADYMVPAHFVVLEKFPLNSNGKLDRKALPAPELGGGGAQRVIVPPRDDAERDLAALWEEILKVKPIGVTDNFFELGGHSFAAALLAAKIAQQLGHAVPLGAILNAPTVEKLANVIKHRLEAGSPRSVVPLQEEGDQPPLFLIAGIGGHVFTYHKFARLLGKRQPTYGIKAIGIDGSVTPPDRIEDIAAHYVREIVELRPKGPYLVGGYSVGALVAYELVLQLRKQGAEVPGLIVFDQLAPGYPKPLPVAKRALIHFRNFMQSPGAEKTKYLAQRWGNVKARVLRTLGLGILNAPEIQLNAPRAEPKTLTGRAMNTILRRRDDLSSSMPQQALKRAWAALNDASKKYEPTTPFPGKVLLVKAQAGFQWAATVIDDPQLGWGEYVGGGIETTVLPGAHLELFSETNIGPLAEAVRGFIVQVAKST
ncbi:MAG: amino acid adenylation domain-containing protein [Planctomycetia bacterium]|nr:amino acid adenylation domain-containing protein [Planctomycetia bacterium]